MIEECETWVCVSGPLAEIPGLTALEHAEVSGH